MPIYEFECESCKNIIEEQRSIHDEVKEVECPKCNQKARKIISKNTFKLEGSGWAKDGY